MIMDSGEFTEGLQSINQSKSILLREASIGTGEINHQCCNND
jgi:hypothetical protein